MKNNPLDDIVKCSIDISSPASNDASFDSILLIVKSPTASGKKTLSTATAITKADDLLEYGYKTGDAAYIAASIALSQFPAPGKIFVCVRKKVGEEAGAGQFEDIKATMSRAVTEAGFYGFHLIDFTDTVDVKAAVEWAEANEKLFGFEYADYAHCPVKNFSYYRSFGMYSGNADGYGEENQPVENRYAALAWMAKCFGYQPGSETWALKPLASIVPSSLSSDQKIRLETDHINTFRRYAGSNVTIGGYTLAGEWIDVIRFRDWLKAEMQANVFGILRANRKVPFTDAGIGLIEGAMEKTLSQGQSIGGIAETTYDSEGNPDYGYSVTVPKAADIPEGEKKTRKLNGCRYTAKLAGAIHAVEISGFLTF